jgi:hypothetical protein
MNFFIDLVIEKYMGLFRLFLVLQWLDLAYMIA